MGGSESDTSEGKKKFKILELENPKAMVLEKKKYKTLELENPKAMELENPKAMEFDENEDEFD